MTARKIDELKQARNRGLRFILFAFGFSIFVNLLMLTGPLFMLQVYDRVLASRSEETLAALFALVAALYALMTVLDFARTRILARFGAQFQSDLDERVFRLAFQRRGHAGASNPAGAQQDLEAVQNAFTSPAFVAFLDMPFTPIFVAAIFIFHPMLGWLAVGGGTFLIVLTVLNQLLTRARSTRASAAQREAQHFSDNAHSGAEVVRAQGMADSVTSRWLDKRFHALKETLGARDRTGGFTAVTKGTRLFLQSAMLAAGAWLVLQNEMTAGAMIAGSILLGRALAPIELSLGQWPVVQRARAGWRSLRELLSDAPVEAERMSLPVPEARLEVRRLSVVPRGSVDPILSNLTVTLAPGQALGVIGRSGSGKTTLARTILGLMRPTTGEVRLGGATIEQYDSAELGRHIGYLPQEPFLFDGTVAENIAKMSDRPDPEAVVAAAKRANVHDIIGTLPDGYNTVISMRDHRLSGGQRQRIALARALFENPQLLVLDEPNSALDAEGTEALNAAVRDFKAEGKTVLIMTHRPMAISECDLLMVMEGGRVTALGPRDEILRSMLQNAGDVKKTISARSAS
ncbi:type I secretion system permease/ATPase [Roseitranquillus sediminis]|uniref:type I secretion system permease/ATPase n=1 Tax=Roseitranquillus sediminis TaxID=2809051 RepID=UPI001D0C0813|nr:type I secretion system permease/ATPase [Roseitranquillus sediminis]MBM9595874.1 type I secretion system permease/ATPase [Roseitranquillus sediminis]